MSQPTPQIGVLIPLSDYLLAVSLLENSRLVFYSNGRINSMVKLLKFQRLYCQKISQRSNVFG